VKRMPIDVLLVDDHTLFRKGMRALLEAEKDIEVVGEAESGQKAVELCADLKPDVALIDIAMPEMNGIIATRQILKASKDTAVLILTMYLSEPFVAETLRSGAKGYVLKDTAVDDLVAAIRAVNGGNVYLSPRAATLVVHRFMDNKDQKARGVLDLLSSRELEILQLIAEGKTTNEIADLLFLSPRTVEKHRSNIMKKLDIHDVPSLVRFTIRAGLLEA
jgi:DNA-binding NarL/FixJ family response regulator